MNAKVVTFAIIGALLVATIYGSSVPTVFGIKNGCSLTPGGDAICVMKDKHVYYCTKVKTTYRCDLQVYKTSNIPTAVQDALNHAIQESQNTTKVPNTDILKDNVTLQENNDNVKIPKAPKVPEDLGGLNNDSG